MVVGCVVPSCREAQAVECVHEWASEWRAHDVRLYVVEDGPARSFRLGPCDGVQMAHLCWADAPAGMLDCITVRSPGCRQIGFWHAYQNACDVIVTLDDDVRPIADEQLFARFAEILTTGLTLWVDPLQNYRSRGFPLHNTGRVPIAFHAGAFFGVPDVDGETQLAHQAEFAARPPEYVRRPTIVPPGQLMPVNGGICGWQRALTPYVHYALWDTDLEYRRFDDIWMGIILKHILDLAGLRMSYGPPGALHVRASDAERNAVLERGAKSWNEQFWEALALAVAARRSSGELGLDAAWAEVVGALDRTGNAWAAREAAAMRAWRRFF
jgi:hypothetical protein